MAAVARALHRRLLPMGEPETTAPEWHDPPGSGMRRCLVRPGDRIDGKYLVRRVLGSGGWGVVYEAEHVVMKHLVAIKVLRSFGSGGALALERFAREARLLAAIRHPHVLEAFDVGHLSDGSPYLVMELLHGEDLDSRLASGPLRIAEVLDIGIQLLDALGALSAHGVVHRDIKPHNLFLHEDEDGDVILKVLDFGIARHELRFAEPVSKLTIEGELVGTPHYMSPEQLRGELLDCRADLYAAAVVLYELLTGRMPFDGPTHDALYASILYAPVPDIHRFRPDCPEELARVVLRGLDRDRETRWQHAAEMSEALREVREALALPAGADAWGPAGRMVRNLPAPRLWPHARLSDALTRTMTPVTIARRPAVRPRRRVRALAAGAAVAVLLPLAGVLAAESVDRPRWRITGKPAAAAAASAETAAAPPPAARAANGAQPCRERVDAPAETVTLTSAQPAARARPDPDSLQRRARHAYVRGQLPRARALYRRAVSLAPGDAEGWRGLGLAAMAMGRRDEARDALRRYLRLAPRSSDASEIRARLGTL